MIEIYGKPACPSCTKAKALCESRGYKFEYYTLGSEFTREELFEQFPTARTFPQIRIDGEAIGGYDNFLDWSSV